MAKITPNQLALINTFVRIVSAGSFSRAAKQLCTSQPTVSRQLRTLEAHLGIQLLNRSTRGISLSEAGQRYYEYARTLSEELDRFENELRSETNIPCGLLRVVVPSGFGQDRLIEVAAQYLKVNPAIRLEWKLSESPVRFVDDAVDCAIQVDTIKDELLIARKLGEVHKIVVAAPALLSRHGDVCQPEDLSKLPWVALSNPHSRSIYPRDRWGNIRKVDISPSFIADSVPVARQAALLGIGAAMISSCAVSADIASGSLTHVLPDWSGLSVPIHLVYPRSQHYPIKLRKFVDLISSLSPELFSSLKPVPFTPFTANAEVLVVGATHLPLQSSAA
ncbi:LysR family transcriptional regulator [Rhodanobacter sp. Col0626]|uniref:LysR family transcriptional regulator n=1 Tax=Rhodanobacter sp. Col0626 TaxID=3415679 RepID=UPI003CEF0953